MAKRGRKTGTIIGSKYEKYRDSDGIIDYPSARADLRGKKRFKDLSVENRRERAFRQGKPLKMLQCPFCGKLTPKEVAVFKSGDYKREPGKFIKYVKVKGKLERRFTGIPPDQLMPVAVQYFGGNLGMFVNEKESLSPDLLKKIDPELYNEYKRILQYTLKQFP